MRKVFALCMLVWLSAATLWAGQPGEWKKVRESEGIIGWSRSNPLSSVDEVRAEGVINAPVPVVEAILRDSPAMKKFMFMCTDAAAIEPAGLKSTKDTYYTYFRQGLPWPVWDRYGVGRIEFMLDKTTGAVLVRGHAVVTDFKPSDKNVIRMPVGEALWILVPGNDHSTKLTYQVLADPAGDLPHSLINMLMKNVGVTTLKNIRKLANQDPYRSAKTIITTTPYHD